MDSTPQALSGGDLAALKRANRLKAVAKDSPRYVALYRRVYAGTASPRQAIKCFCVDCCGSMDEIKTCTAPACPLFSYRPYRPQTNACLCKAESLMETGAEE